MTGSSYSGPIKVDYQAARYQADESLPETPRVGAGPRVNVDPSGAFDIFVLALSTCLTLATFYVVAEAPWPQRTAGRPTIGRAHDHAVLEASARVKPDETRR